MKVTNRASHDVVAFWWDSKKGYGDDVLVPAGQTVEIDGPAISTKEIVCHEGHDSKREFRIRKGVQLVVGSRCGVIIRHHADKPEHYVTLWRSRQKSLLHRVS
ncbi:MAG: hypothetical protein HY432_01835 [Candidatus Liptonbacteria bacterium]|nr:hypothetical protein [Candidatus Liptonbacteria bacterium]